MQRWTLKEARTRKGLTQTALAELSDLEQSRISAIETGAIKQPEIATMRKLAEALGMDALLSTSGLVFEERQEAKA